MATTFAIEEARDEPALAQARELFKEYQKHLGISLDFQGFEAELRGLPGAYAPPRGALLLAYAANDPAGCIALRRLSDDEAEIKRLYVRPAWRGSGLGKALVEAVIERARRKRYRGLRLDTLASMAPAMRLYERLGFVETPPYHSATLPGMRFFLKPLAHAASG